MQSQWCKNHDAGGSLRASVCHHNIKIFSHTTNSTTFAWRNRCMLLLYNFEGLTRHAQCGSAVAKAFKLLLKMGTMGSWAAV